MIGGSMGLKAFLKKHNITIKPEFDDKPVALTGHPDWQIMSSFFSRDKKVVLLINIVKSQYEYWSDYSSKEVEKDIDSMLSFYGMKLESKVQAKEGSEYAKYEAFFREILPSAKKCRIEGLLKIKSENGLWQPAGNNIEVYKSLAVDHELHPYKVKYHFDRYQMAQKPELLCHQEDWDGRDHIAEMVSHIYCSNMTNPEMIELIKQWFAKAIARIETSEQNQMLIFQGGQGVGKDRFISELCGGFRPYFSHFTDTIQEKDMFMQIAQNLIINISEFDKLNRQHPGRVKDLISRDSASFRPSYGRYHENYPMRASFIGSVNYREFLTDETGNRRFWIFDDVHIDWAYPKGRGAQVFAQAKVLSAENYRASSATIDKMARWVESSGPESQDNMIIEFWNDELKKLARFGDKNFSFSEIEPIMQRISRSFGYKNIRKIQIILKRLGAQINSNGVRTYRPIESSVLGMQIGTRKVQ